MRIVILDTGGPPADLKDQGQILGGLRDLGVDARLMLLNTPNLWADERFVAVEPSDSTNVNFWRKNQADIILFFSRLNPRYTKILETIKNSGKIVIIKADSDGTLGYPLAPNYLRTLKVSRQPIRWILSNIKWRLPIGHFVKQKIEQIQLADAVILETPEALANVAYVLHFWHRDNLINKLHFIPNPVTTDIVSAPLAGKTDTVISIGRWEDEGCKNTQVMLRAAADFLNVKKDYQYIIVGSGRDKILPFIQQLSPEISSRITMSGAVSHQQIPKLLVKSRIFLMPSNLESFGIAAAEALCMGCSVVGTPLESFRYLTASGFSGTIARGFQKTSIVNALIEDSIKWENGQYHHDEIANFWRKRSDRKKIVQEILKIAGYFKNNA